MNKFVEANDLYELILGRFRLNGDRDVFLTKGMMVDPFLEAVLNRLYKEELIMKPFVVKGRWIFYGDSELMKMPDEFKGEFCYLTFTDFAREKFLGLSNRELFRKIIINLRGVYPDPMAVTWDIKKDPLYDDTLRYFADCNWIKGLSLALVPGDEKARVLVGADLTSWVLSDLGVKVLMDDSWS